MKKLFGTLLALICLLSPLVLAEEETPEWIIDVVEGRFIMGDTVLALADCEHPIAIGFLRGEAFVTVTTPDSVEELSLGKVQLALTEAAAPFVTELEFAADLDSGGPPCAICGRSLSLGNHTKLRCGHYGCLMVAGHPQICSGCHGYTCSSRDHSVCFSCGVRQCVHVDIECEYTRNPVPTPHTTKAADGTVSTVWVDPSGAVAYGNPGVATWAPAQDYIKQFTTPPPEPAPGDGMQGEIED